MFSSKYSLKVLVIAFTIVCINVQTVQQSAMDLVIENTLKDMMTPKPRVSSSATNKGLMMSKNGGLSYLGMMHQFKKEAKKTKTMSVTSIGYLNTYMKVLKNENVRKMNREMKNSWMKVVGCPKKPNIKCDRFSPYRTFDGTCNNLNNPEYGRSFRPQNRFLPAEYDDGLDSPRTRSKSGGRLPSARAVSNNVFRQKGDNLDNRLTLMVMSWGQFIEHDVLFTPMSTEDEQGNLILCCNTKTPLSYTGYYFIKNMVGVTWWVSHVKQEMQIIYEEPDHASRSECFPIRIPTDDPFFKSKCMEFVRSSPVLKDRCDTEHLQREQINELTSFFDASNVYGSTKEQTDKLRLFHNGLLKTSAGRLLPPRDDQTSCTLSEKGDFCFLAGDTRVQEVPTLAAIHVTFVRFHNYIALKLGKLNHHWNGEKIFQETRKILGALMQKITYEEYLPVILNKDFRRKFCLESNCKIYDDKIDATTVNSFGVTAFRFGHSQINAFTAIFKPSSRCPYGAPRCPFSRVKEVERIPVENTFKNPHFVFKDVDGLQIFQSTNASTKSDREFDPSIRDSLFLDTDSNSLDLEALDIQRGRDHGMPSYTKFREFCGLSKVVFFYAGRNGLNDHDSKTVHLLRKTYKHVDDIDLWVGGMTERPLPGSEVGPTFNCLMAKQFQLYKTGDRFWWERRDRVVGFTSGQLRALKRLRYSKILCDMHNIPDIQPYVMVLPTLKWNRPRKCHSLPSLDLDPWRERRKYRY